MGSSKLMEKNEHDRHQVTLAVTRKLLDEIRQGDLDQGLNISEMLLSEGPNFSPELLVVLVEAVVELSAQAGSEDARNYLNEMWPSLKTAHLRRLDRKKS